MSRPPIDIMAPHFFDVIEVIEVLEDGSVLSARRWVSESGHPERAKETLRRAHEMARNRGGVVIGSSPTVLGDYRQP